MEQIDLSKLTITELKALGFDVLSSLDNNRQTLQKIDAMIAQRTKEQEAKLAITEQHEHS